MTVEPYIIKSSPRLEHCVNIRMDNETVRRLKIRHYQLTEERHVKISENLYVNYGTLPGTTYPSFYQKTFYNF